MKNNTQILKFATVATALAASGCTLNGINEINDNNDKSIMDSQAVKEQSSRVDKELVQSKVLDKYFIASTPYEMTNHEILPEFFQENIVFNKKSPQSVNQIVSQFANETDLQIIVTEDATQWINGDVDVDDDDNGDDLPEMTDSSVVGGNKNTNVDDPSSGYMGNASETDIPWATEGSAALVRPDYKGEGLRLSEQTFTFTFNGSVAAALDAFTQRLDVNWVWEDGRIKIFKSEVKHYTFDGANSSVSFNSETTTETSNDETSSSSGHTTKYENIYEPMFKEIGNTLKEMMSTYGKFYINSNTGLITVRDTPQIQRQVKEYIDRMNTIVSKRIMIKTDIVDILSDENGEYGLNLNAIYSGSGNFNFNYNPITGLPDDIGNSMSIGILDGVRNWSGSSAMLTALSEMNKSVDKTSSVVSTRNGQPVPIQIVQRKNYVKSITKETDDEGNDSYEMEIDRVQPGLSMTMVPKLTSRGKIALQFAMDMKKLNGIETFVAGDSQAQLPDETQKAFMQDVVIKNGSTLMIAGIEQDVDANSNTGMDGSWTNSWFWWLGGSKSGGKRKLMTIVLITPYVMNM